MKIKIAKKELGGMSAAQYLRRAGYALIYDRRSGQESFSRRFGREFYPRFHLYVQELPNTDYLFFNLHLDHKQASYEGVTRHSADYDGELVSEEANRLKGQFSSSSAIKEQSKANLSEDVLQNITKFDPSEYKVVKKSFWQKLFP